MSRQQSKTMDKKTSSPDIYVGLLFVSAAALVTGCIFLVMQLNAYGWKLAS